MATVLAFVLLLVADVVVLVSGDVYCHNPRCSNNRLMEKTANRKDGNRMFDSQNNNKGGYNVGDKEDRGNNGHVDKQYQMRYFQSGPKGKGQSHLQVEWTNQHGCGRNLPNDPIKLNCQMVIQYMCQPEDANLDDPQRDVIRDGGRQGRNDYTAPPNNGPKEETKQAAVNRLKVSNPQKGMNEPPQWRDKCEARPRNGGLFIADQNVGAAAKNTRQNPNGNRNGYECAEERDYYPYWHPTDWKDAAILVEDDSRCPKLKAQSFSLDQTYNECQENFKDGPPAHYSKANNEAACTARGGTWRSYHNFLEKLETAQNTRATSQAQCSQLAAAKNIPAGDVVYAYALYGTEKECLVKLPQPDCRLANYTRVNHLGNSGNLKASKYDWVLPRFPSGRTQRCVFRLRYNISTDDYSPDLDSAGNGDQVIQGNPNVDIGLDNGQKLRLAINTAQFGRTFQDRSHVFHLKPRTAEIGDEKDIYNCNVRGKRGNIVQTYPAVEYDFVPNDLEIGLDDLLHVQWTGSNTHDNNPPAGDGQAGDDGEGTGGTDRSNIMTMADDSLNFFLPLEHPNNLIHHLQPVWTPEGFPNADSLTPIDTGLILATAGHYKSYDHMKQTTTRKMNNLLNNAPASFEGMVARFTATGNFSYGCTRNNNFSNRSQKAKFCVVEGTKRRRR